MRKYWKRWLRLLLAGASGVAIFIGSWLALPDIAPVRASAPETIQNNILGGVHPGSVAYIQLGKRVAPNFQVSPTNTLTSTLPVTPTLTPTPTYTPTATPTEIPFPTPECNYDAKFEKDITIPDGYEFKPGESFIKTWQIRNTGNCAWEEGTKWVFISGEQMGGVEVIVPPTERGGTADISVNLTAPNAPGTYAGCWGMRWLNGEIFGNTSDNNCDRLHVAYVKVVVVADVPPSPTASDTPTPLLTATDTPVPPSPTPETPVSSPIYTSTSLPPVDTLPPSPPDNGGSNLFIILGFIGLVGLLGIVTGARKDLRAPMKYVSSASSDC